MTARIEKTVFISYRRTNLPWALAIYQHLTSQGYDVFFDYLSIPSGDFEKIIIENIRGRTHFIVVLTPSALDRCNEPKDWLRREIETAMDERRNIVPIMLESFDFGSPSTVKALSGKLENLKKYNGLRIPSEYFFEAMNRLREQFLNIALDGVVHPISDNAQQITEEHKLAADDAEQVEQKELTAQEWFERGFKFNEDENFDEALRCYTEAIRLNQKYAPAYNNRGDVYISKNKFDRAIADFNRAILLHPDLAVAYGNRGFVLFENKGDLKKALSDFNDAIKLAPNDYHSYNNRGRVYNKLGKYDKALADYNASIKYSPNYPYPYINRGSIHQKNGNIDQAIKDFNKAIRLKPDFDTAFIYRGNLRSGKGDLHGAIQDYNKAIRLNPDNPIVYYNRALIWEEKKDYPSAITDYKKYLELGGGTLDGDKKKVEEKIKKLKSNLTKKKSVKKKSK